MLINLPKKLLRFYFVALLMTKIEAMRISRSMTRHTMRATVTLQQNSKALTLSESPLNVL
jgi:hypothetical protein